MFVAPDDPVLTAFGEAKSPLVMGEAMLMNLPLFYPPTVFSRPPRLRLTVELQYTKKPSAFGFAYAE
jgi:hypothetical protein